MRALVVHAARDLRLEDRPVGEPGSGAVRLRLAVGGVCGSDLRYRAHGGFGAVRLREPMILGREISATIEALGPGFEGLSPGDLVAAARRGPAEAAAGAFPAWATTA